MDKDDKQVNTQIAADIADIKANIGFIREIAENVREDFKEHKKDDVTYYKKTDRNSVYITLLWIIFGFAAISSVAQNVLQATGLTGGHNEKQNINANAFIQSAAAAPIRA